MRELGKSLVFATAFFWLGLTLFVDFFSVPLIFRTIEDLFLAGRVGGKLFSILNSLEILLGLILILGVYLIFKLNKKVLLFLSSFLFGLSLYYKLSLTPNIIYYSKLMEDYGKDKIEKDQGQNEKQEFYHSLYIKLDTFKIICLFILLGLMSKDYLYPSTEELKS